MLIAGSASIGNDQYFLAIKELKNKVHYFLISPEPVREVENGNEPSVVIHDADALPRYYTREHLMESIRRSKVTGSVAKWGTGNAIELFLSVIAYAKNYRFDEESIALHYDEDENDRRIQKFAASDRNVDYRYATENGDMTYLYVRRNQFTLDLHEMQFRISDSGLKYKDVSNSERSNLLCSTIKTITLADLDDALDMSWYHDGDTVLKDYRTVQNVYDFEMQVMTPLIKLGMHASKDDPVVVSLDTETTGVGIYNLSKDNPDRSHCVCVQLSWEEDAGVAVFTDMEHFQNVTNEYVAERLMSLFRWYKGEAEIHYWEPGDSRTLVSCQKKYAVLTRDCFFLVGHNFPFDRRTMYQTDKSDIWFNADTLQMAFCLNPQIVRGNNKLKVLTRRIFHHETPELTDILGPGNEDKYRYLTDITVAAIYGCADVDYTRKLFFFLKNLMPLPLYYRYLQQDVDISNILAISEYYGMNTIEDKVLSLANQTWENLEILKHAAWSYVGVYMDYSQKMSMLESLWTAGGISSEEEYRRMQDSVTVDEDAVYEFEFKASALREILYHLLKYPIYDYTKGKQKLPKVDKLVIKKLMKAKRSAGSCARELQHDILAYGVDRSEYEQLKNGSEKDKKKAESMCLVSADQFNSLEYPMALIVSKYSDLNKEYTSYFKPILEGNLEGKIFKSYSLARIETRRIQNPGQTMKGNLKALIRSYSDDYYLLDFDMSQVEYRIMLSLAGFIAMVKRMEHPERDYHTETASMVNNIPPHKVSKKVRKEAKSISFGVPYGLGERSLCENMFGVINDETLFATRMLLYKWKQNNQPVMQLLEEARAEALEEWNISDALREFMGAWERDENGEVIIDADGNKVPLPVSRVTNPFGFYRVFNVKDVGQSPADKARRESGKFDSVESGIRRKAGNYRIQSFAAELFRIILTRFYWRCVDEGISDKIVWHMLIHDELLCSVHKSLHPFYIYKLVKESCMITMKGHTKYFVGINVGDTWAECKDDAREAPIYFVNRMIKQWDAGVFSPKETSQEYLKDGDPAKGYWFDHPWEFIRPYREKYVEDRIGEIIRTLIDIDAGPIDVPALLEKFDNYTVRAYVNDYPKNSPVNKDDFVIDTDEAGKPVYNQDAFDDCVWSSRLESWALDAFGEGKAFIRPDGTCIALKRYTEEEVDIEDEFTDFAELFNDESFDSEREWSYDDGVAESAYQKDILDLSEADDFEQPEIDYSRSDTAVSIAEMFVRKSKYEAIKLINNQLIISHKTQKQVDACKKMLLKYKASAGVRVVFKDSIGRMSMWVRIMENADFNFIDKCVVEIMNETAGRTGTGVAVRDYKVLRVQGTHVLLPVKSRPQQRKAEAFLAQNAVSGGVKVVFRTALGELVQSRYTVAPDFLPSLDDFIVNSEVI